MLFIQMQEGRYFNATIINTVEVKKTTQKRVSEGCFLVGNSYSKKVSHHHLEVVETQKQVEKWESFMWKKGKASRVP